MWVQIHVKGHLDARWCEILGGLEIAQKEDGTSLLSGVLPDQAALYGVLLQIRALGISLVALESRFSQPMSDTAQSNLHLTLDSMKG